MLWQPLPLAQPHQHTSERAKSPSMPAQKPSRIPRAPGISSKSPKHGSEFYSSRAQSHGSLTSAQCHVPPVIWHMPAHLAPATSAVSQMPLLSAGPKHCASTDKSQAMSTDANSAISRASQLSKASAFRTQGVLQSSPKRLGKALRSSVGRCLSEGAASGRNFLSRDTPLAGAQPFRSLGSRHAEQIATTAADADHFSHRSARGWKSSAGSTCSGSATTGTRFHWNRISFVIELLMSMSICCASFCTPPDMACSRSIYLGTK